MWNRSEVLRTVRVPYLHIRAKQIIPVYPWSHSIPRNKQDMMCMCQQHTTPHHTTRHSKLHRTTPHNKLHRTTPHHTTYYTAPHHTTQHTTPHRTTPHNKLHHTTQHNKLHHTTPHHTTNYTRPHHTDNRLCDTYESDWNSNINFYIHPTRTQDTPHDILNTHLIS